jgi:transcription elongation factor GreA
MIEALKEKLSAEVAKLRYELTVTLPQEIKKAVDHGDLRENSEYKAALERQRFVQARLSQLTQRLSKLSDIDITQIPTDRVGLGSRVTVEDQVTEEREVYELVFGDGGELIEGQVSMSSPIGLALQNKVVGESAILKLPARTRRLRIVELITFHQIELM